MSLSEQKIVLIGQIEDLLNRLSEQQTASDIIRLNSNFRIGRNDGIASQVFDFDFSYPDQVYLSDALADEYAESDLYRYDLADLYMEDLRKIVDALQTGFYTFI